MSLQLIDLLTKGYLPIELPPPFTAAQYAQELAGPTAALPGGAAASQPRFSTACVHNLVRTGGLRRNLGIPNPKHFYRLAEHVTVNWANLTACANASPFSMSKPTADGRFERAISPEHDLAERTAKRAHLRASGRFILRTDISRFFPSIYSHSIPWAIMGKAAAKAAHASGTLNGTWQDVTDVLCRSVNNNQTVGIPIGPDTSRLLAEVLLARIDSDLATKFRRLRGFRYIDDYEFAFPTRSEAEEVLSFIQQLLNEFELALNPNKTAIVELPDNFDAEWASRIRIFMFRDAGVTGQRNDLTAYFDMVFDFFKRFPEEGLLKYAIARLRSEEIRRQNWPLLENILSHCVLVEPACIPQVADQLAYYRGKRYPMNKRLWSECLNRIVYERAPLGQSSEVAWSMWLMKMLNIKLSYTSARAVEQSEDSIVGLMALGLGSSGLVNINNLTALHRFSTASHLFSSQWLLCYQGNLMGWLDPTSGRTVLRADPFFAYLESRNVSFFDLGITPPAPKRHKMSPLDIRDGGAGWTTTSV
jgi:hypothetical protein